MESNIFFEILLASSVFTSLFIEALKKLAPKKFAYNTATAVTSLFMSSFIIALYVVYYDIAIDRQLIVASIVLVLLSFLCSTCGYDKVIQAIEQIRKK